MKAAYYDTNSHTLSKNGIAFRIRSEGDKVMATLKWKDDESKVAGQGLYKRLELNVPLSAADGAESCFANPDPSIFKESPEGREMLGMIEGAPLKRVFDTVFTRRMMRIDFQGSIMEVSLDVGDVLAGGSSLPIHELEIELYSGSEDDLTEIGRQTVEKYGLRPETRSKYARGVYLLGI
jgi:triphosphatase